MVKKKEDWKKSFNKAMCAIKLPKIETQSGKADEVEIERYTMINGEERVIFSMPKKK